MRSAGCVYSLAFRKATFGESRPPPPPSKAEEVAVSNCDAIGYSVKLDVYPKKVRFAILFNGEEVIHSWSGIRGARELDLMQSISYAAHMCYKQKEMKVI